MRKKRKGALHEPEGRTRQSPARRLCIAKLRRARSDAPYRFMAPMHVGKPEQAYHKITRSMTPDCCRLCACGYARRCTRGDLGEVQRC